MIPLFKPNKFGTGTLVDFSLQSSRKEKGKSGLYLKIIKQCGPLASPFAGSKEICVIKFNELELSGLINSIDRKIKWSTVHKTEKSNRSITFDVLYRKDESGQPTKEVSGFAFNTSANGQKFGFTLSLIESVLIKELFRWVISHLLDGRYSEEKTRIKDSIKLKAAPIEEESEVVEPNEVELD